MWTLVLSLFLATSEAGVPNNMTLTGLNGDKIEAKEFEGILRPIFQEDEWILILVGAILGALAGVGQLVFLFSG